MRVLRLPFASVVLLMLVLLPDANAQTYHLLYSFSAGSDGGGPVGKLIRDSSGNLYGEAHFGGDLSCGSIGCGVIFELSPTGVETVLHTFTGKDGWSPSGDMAYNGANIFFGTTTLGGDLNVGCNPGGRVQGCGVVFRLNKATGQFTVLHTFEGGADGGEPFGIVRDKSGNLYGTTATGGLSGGCGGYTCGTIYKLDPTGKHTVLYNFTGGSDGGLPISVTLDSAGNLYGATIAGGTGNCVDSPFGKGCGTVFELTTAGELKVLHTFGGGKGGDNGSAVGGSNASLLVSPSGALFGTSLFGGLQDCPNYPGCGVVYKITPPARETVLYSFTGATDGAMPTYGLAFAPAGNLYGTTTIGGGTLGCPSGCGTVFKLDPKTGQLVTLYAFTDHIDGYYPTDVIVDGAGNVYGETVGGGGDFGIGGTIFKITP